jgi:Mlc titration factor MtfA (ptsG expression regulator)
MVSLLILASLLVGVYFIVKPKKKKSGFSTPNEFPNKWKTYLNKTVQFYRDLDTAEKKQFEADVLDFFKRIRITGIKTNVTDEDRLLVASSAVIPVFAFKDWKYSHLSEVLLYPDSFNKDYSIGKENARITGMVGNGAMANIIIFSKPALHLGFKNSKDKKNVGIHEFIHLFDKEDGSIDGIPEVAMNHQYSLPWLKLLLEKTQQIKKGETDINPYGSTNAQEFLAVTSEYFFERPKLLKQKHPELYETLRVVFKTDLAEREVSKNTEGPIRRNDPCPCGSGKKFKQCCLK